MSILLSLKMNELTFKTTEMLVKRTGMTRNAYINQAVEFFNRLQKRKDLAKALRVESKRVSKESLAILHAFEELDDPDPTP